MSLTHIDRMPDVNCKFLGRFSYNFYEANENKTTDNIIQLHENSDYQTKSINLSFDSQIIYDSNILNFVNNKFLDLFDQFHLKKISERDLRKFNVKSKVDNFITETVMQSNQDYIDKKLRSLNMDGVNFSLSKEKIASNKKVTINNKYFNNFLDNNFKNSFRDKKTVNELSNLNEKIQDFSRSDDFEKERDKNYLGPKSKRNVLYTETNFNTSKSYYCHIGFLLQKYKIKNNKEHLLDNIFIFNKTLKNESNDAFRVEGSNYINNFKFNLKDVALRYGHVYEYYLHPVFIFCIPKKNDYYLKDFYLKTDTGITSGRIECKEHKRPNPPTNIRFKAKNNKSIDITWQKSYSSQGDVKGYQIFKRNSLDDPYTLVKQIDFFDFENEGLERKNINSFDVVSKQYHTTEYADNSFNSNIINFYAICAIDARGYTSNYSSQYGVKYNKNIEKCEIDLISSAGAPLHMPNLFLPKKTRFIENDNKVVENIVIENNVQKITLYSTPEFVNLVDDSETVQILKSNYKFSIYSLEDNTSFISDINLNNFLNQD